MPLTGPSARAPFETPPCPKCGSTQTTVTGKSEAPPMTYVRCGACGYITAVVTR